MILIRSVRPSKSQTVSSPSSSVRVPVIFHHILVVLPYMDELAQSVVASNDLGCSLQVQNVRLATSWIVGKFHA